MLHSDTPAWQPLLDLAPEHIDDFMWMFEVELEGGPRLHAYKHYWTRRYLHLDHEGRGFFYREDGRYQEIDPIRQLDAVLMVERPGPPPYDSVRQNRWRGSLELSWARPATKHRISRARSRHVVENCEMFFAQAGSEDDFEDARLVFLGDDAEEIAIEVMAVEVEDGGLLVIHAMRLRGRYREQYEEATRWRR